MVRMRAVVVIALALVTVAGVAGAQERFLLDNLQYSTISTPYGPVTFSETQFPLDSTINGRTITKLNADTLPAPLAFSFSQFGAPSTDAHVRDYGGLPFVGLEDDMIEGTSGGTLGIDFGTDVNGASFAFALQYLGPLAGACTVTAFDSTGVQVGPPLTCEADSLYLYSEGACGFKSRTGFRRIEVAFANPFPEKIPAAGSAGLATLAALVALAGAIAVRRTC